MSAVLIFSTQPCAAHFGDEASAEAEGAVDAGDYGIWDCCASSGGRRC